MAKRGFAWLGLDAQRRVERACRLQPAAWGRKPSFPETGTRRALRHVDLFQEGGDLRVAGRAVEDLREKVRDSRREAEAAQRQPFDDVSAEIHGPRQAASQRRFYRLIIEDHSAHTQPAGMQGEPQHVG